MPKVKKQKAHLRRTRLQLAEKHQKSLEIDPIEPVPDQPSTETNPVELEQCTEDQPSTSGVAPEAEKTEGSSSSDPDFDPEEAPLKDPDAMTEGFVADWIAMLPRDDVYALSPPLSCLAARISPAHVCSLQNHWQGVQ